MKRLFLVCSLLAVSCVPVLAQSAAAKTEASAQQDPKVAFRTKIVELRASKTSDAAMKTYMELSEMMHKSITKNSEAFSKSTNATERTKLGKAIAEQQAIYRDTKMMTREITKNQGDIATKLESFLQMM